MNKAKGNGIKNVYLAVAFGVTAALIWGAFPVITKLGIEETLTPYDITALRFSVSGILLLPLFWRRGLGGVSWRGAAILMCGAGAPYTILAASGLSFAPAGHFGVITPSCMILFSAFGGWFWLGDKPSGMRIMGMTIIVVGLFVLGWDGLSNGGSKTWIGDLMFVAAGLLWGSYTIASRFWAIDSIHAIAIVSTISLVLYVPLYIVSGESRIMSASLAEVGIQALYQGVFAAILALLLYTRAVAILGVGRGAVFGALIPSFALLLALPILHEIPTYLQLIGVVLVTVGMLLALELYRPGKPDTKHT